MADNELRLLFAKNLKYYMDMAGLNQADLRRLMGVSSATVSEWCSGKKIPRTDKINTICYYLGIGIDDLLSDNNDGDDATPSSGYYTNPETARLAQEMFEDPDMRSLFSMKRNMDPKQFKAYLDFMKMQYRLEHPED